MRTLGPKASELISFTATFGPLVEGGEVRLLVTDTLSLTHAVVSCL